MIAVYEAMYEKKPTVTAIHAGLECGLFADKIKDVDMVSFGPDIFGAHSPDERMSIIHVFIFISSEVLRRSLFFNMLAI